MTSVLSVRGAAEHNLREVDLDLPLGAWISVVGPSGSGKTSLVFDSIVREGQRRFLGALSARARHFYGKLGRGEVAAISGLQAAIAVGQHTATDNVRSTVGTLTGALDLLRLLFARCAQDPGGVELTRSHFSFNQSVGACEACGGIGLEDRVAPELLVEDASKTIRGGALKPTLKSGYTVYSQVTVDVMDEICRAHGFDIDTPWQALTDEQRGVVLYGTQALKVPFGKHAIESRMRWEGITARPREEGYYRGLVPVIEETLTRNRNSNVLRFVRSMPCSACAGSRLARAGREAALGEFRLPALLELPANELNRALDTLPPSEVWSALRPSLEERLVRMERLGLGHLALERPSGTLSGGEAQRLRLAAQLSAGLGRQLIALDEPTLGLHPSEQEGMRAVLDELRALGNTLLVVEHDPDMVRHADHLVRLGPGAGPDGGRVLESGPLTASTPDPLGTPPPRKLAPRAGRGVMTLSGARLHNLDDAELRVQLGTLNVVIGPSGAGKSSLVFGTLLPALGLTRPGEAAGPYAELTGAPGATRASGRRGAQAVDARPIGRTPRSTPATWSGLFELVRKRFAAEPAAKARGFGPGHFSYNNKAGRCSACEGLGFQRIGLHLMEDVELDCAQCGGGRYAPDLLDVRVRGRNIAEVLAMTVLEACEYFADDPPLLSTCRAMETLGLGYLCLGHASNKLSRGEAQRVKLATLLGSPSAKESLLFLDEPDRGLHPSDVERLLGALDALVDAGHTVVAISHHRHLWAAADHVVEVRDGRTRHDPELDLAPLTRVREARPPARAADAIRLTGVRTHNLRGDDHLIPHGQITVVAGVSGSGKSSLVFDTLASEAWHRFSESLPFQVRRFMRRAARPAIEGAEGLGPTLALRQGQARAGAGSTVATQSEIGPLLRLLYSRAGRVDAAPCGFSAAHFSTEQALGACPACEGRGVIARCDPDRLVTQPDQALAAGALSGTRPGRFFSEADGQHIATLRAAIGSEVDLDVPWSELPEPVRRIALEGAGDAVFDVRWEFKRGQRSGEHGFQSSWDGFCALVEREARRRAGARKAEEWRAPLIELACGECGGGGLRPEVARVALGHLRLADVMGLPLAEVAPELEACELDEPAAAVLQALLPELRARTADLVALGLGHLSLGRKSRSLSDGEMQRVRLASVLRSGLTGVTLALDEPGAGLHARDLARMLERLQELRDAGNTLVLVSHRAELLRAADHLIELGPGAGTQGGRLLEAGPPEAVLAGAGPTAAALRANAQHASKRTTASLAVERLCIRGARANNLRELDVTLPTSGFVCITGVSGSGKSSLLFDVLDASMRAGAPIECAAIDLLDGGGHPQPNGAFDRFVTLESSRRGGAGSTVLSSLGLLAPMQALYHAAASGAGLPKAAFSFQSPSGRCTSCAGTGREPVAMDFLADLVLPCPACDGRRYRDEVLAVRWSDLNVAEFLERPVEELAALVPDGKLNKGLDALVEVGLGYLALGRRRAELSGGESQRVALAAGLIGGASPTLYLLDEPASGLHEADIARLVRVFSRLTERGALVVAAEHRGSLIDAADWHIELGPESGAAGGRLLACGPAH